MSLVLLVGRAVSMGMFWGVCKVSSTLGPCLLMGGAVFLFFWLLKENNQRKKFQTKTKNKNKTKPQKSKDNNTQKQKTEKQNKN